jgi:hypothetical protein
METDIMETDIMETDIMETDPRSSLACTEPPSPTEDEVESSVAEAQKAEKAAKKPS